jgi:hypothetical protein
MKSSLKIVDGKGGIANAQAVAAAAKTAAARLEVLASLKKLHIHHQNDHVLCGLFLRSHHYAVHSDTKGLLFTGIQQLHRFGSSNSRTGPSMPLLLYHLSHDPILELHFGAPALFQFSPSCVAVTLPSEVLIGSLKKEEQSAKTILGDVYTTIRAFDVNGQYLFAANPGGISHAGETKHDVMSARTKKQIALIKSNSGNAYLQFREDNATDIKALLLATALWLEMIERNKPRWRTRRN